MNVDITGYLTQRLDKYNNLHIKLDNELDALTIKKLNFCESFMKKQFRFQEIKCPYSKNKVKLKFKKNKGIPIKNLDKTLCSLEDIVGSRVQISSEIKDYNFTNKNNEVIKGWYLNIIDINVI